VGEQVAQGRVLAPDRQECRRILQDLIIFGAQGIILGCTEMGLLMLQADSSVPLFDMMELHALAAAEQSVCN